jgi:hypothetical protein
MQGAGVPSRLNGLNGAATGVRMRRMLLVRWRRPVAGSMGCKFQGARLQIRIARFSQPLFRFQIRPAIAK